jgi:hypothetical protein
MYDIVTLEPDNDEVKTALEKILGGQSDVIPDPKGGYTLFKPNAKPVERNGGGTESVLVIVGHGGPNVLSGKLTWREYKQALPGAWTERTPKSVWIVSCSTAGEGHGFLTGNIAREVKRDYPDPISVWASETGVDPEDLTGDWQVMKKAA